MLIVKMWVVASLGVKLDGDKFLDPNSGIGLVQTPHGVSSRRLACGCRNRRVSGITIYAKKFSRLLLFPVTLTTTLGLRFAFRDFHKKYTPVRTRNEYPES